VYSVPSVEIIETPSKSTVLRAKVIRVEQE